ncbi:MAG: response regulator [Thermodesulfobacteriota bacterium]
MEAATSHSVLVVDDNPVNLLQLSAILHAENYTVIPCSSSEEALEYLKQQSPDIILLDVMIPDMDGFSLCRTIKQDTRFADIPLIFITSLSQQEDIVGGFNAGGNDYIVKPFNRHELLARLRNHIRLHDTLCENRRLIEKTEDSSRSKTEFLATMSHEIRTPLNSIIGMSEVLADTRLTSDQRKCVRIVRSAGESLLELINDILDLSKIEAGQIEVEAIDFHLPSLLQSVSSILSMRAAEQNTPISITIHPEVPTALNGDPARLRQVLLNLVGNGIKFTQNGSVAISVRLDSDDMLLFSISDNGVGIAKEQQERIFESFTQADSLTTRTYGGTGLGLTISQKLTKIMGGRIWLESTPGMGSTFFFTCRFQDAISEPEPGPERSTFSPDHPPMPPAHILIVDDNEDNRNLLNFYLRDTPLTLETAENGEEAVALFNKSSFDLVVMDIEMPILDGYDATRQLRRLEKEQGLAPIPIIALTAHAFIRFRRNCLEAGCSDYLSKPIRRENLLRTISAHLRGEQSSAHPPPPESSRRSETTGRRKFLPPQVSLDPKIKKLIPRFLEYKRRDVRHLLENDVTSDMDELLRQAHTIKGTSWMYGFQELGDTCLSLEQAARKGDRQLAHQLILQIRDYLNEVQIDYDENPGEGS